MMYVRIDCNNFELEVRGHANYAEHGKDIVCASASILTYTLADTIEKNREYLRESPEIAIVPGNAVIKCKPGAGHIFMFYNAFRVICNGFGLLSENYPGNVNFVEVSG